MTPREALQAAIEACPGKTATALAARIGNGVVRQNVEYWLKVGRVPAEHAPSIERETGIKCEWLCPEVAWSVLRERSAVARQLKPNPGHEADCQHEQQVVDGTLCTSTAIPMERQADGCLRCAACGQGEAIASVEAKAA